MGSNAVAGVINIITKDSASTLGFIIAVGACTEENGFASVRNGGNTGEIFNYRVYGKYRDRDLVHRTDGALIFDDKLICQGGFRAEWQPGEFDEITFQGGYYGFKPGYRTQITSKLSLDITGSVNYYENLIELTMGVLFGELFPAPPDGVALLIFDNALEGEGFGVEVNGECNSVPKWRIIGGYTFSTVDLCSTLGNVILAGFSAEDDPRHLFNFRSYLNISDSIEFDTLLYYRGKNVNRILPSHTRLDLRLGWKLMSNLELSLIDENLSSKHHSEFGDKAEYRTETQ